MCPKDGVANAESIPVEIHAYVHGFTTPERKGSFSEPWHVLLQSNSSSCDYNFCAQSSQSGGRRHFSVHSHVCVSASGFFSELFDVAVRDPFLRCPLPVVDLAPYTAEAVEVVLKNIYHFPCTAETLSFELICEVRDFALIAGLPKLVKDMDGMILLKLTSSNFCKAIGR